MTRKGWLGVLAVTAAIIIAGVVFHDVGVVVAAAFLAVNIVLLSARLPVSEFIRLETVYQIVERDKEAAVELASPCPYSCAFAQRHVHGAEMLEHTASEKMARAYGHAKLSEALVRDTQHSLEVGVYWCFALFLVWGVVTFARGPTAAAADTGLTELDPWKGAITALIGLVGLFNCLGRLHWFRKQNGALQQPLGDQRSGQSRSNRMTSGPSSAPAT